MATSPPDAMDTAIDIYGHPAAQRLGAGRRGPAQGRQGDRVRIPQAHGETGPRVGAGDDYVEEAPAAETDGGVAAGFNGQEAADQLGKVSHAGAGSRMAPADSTSRCSRADQGGDPGRGVRVQRAGCRVPGAGFGGETRVGIGVTGDRGGPGRFGQSLTTIST